MRRLLQYMNPPQLELDSFYCFHNNKGNYKLLKPVLSMLRMPSMFMCPAAPAGRDIWSISVSMDGLLYNSQFYICTVVAMPDW